jgi:PAS domain S-box-containing protein
VETIEKRVSLALVAIGAVILLVVCLAYREGSATVDAITWVAHTHEVLAGLEGLQADLADVRLNAVRYVSTGRPADLAAYQSSRDQIRQRLSRLRQLTSDNPRQQRRLSLLEQALAERVSFQESAISMRGPAGPVAALQFLWSDAARAAMAAMQKTIAEMAAEEKGLLLQRDTEFNSSRRKAWLTLVSLGAIVLLLLGLVSYTLERDIRTRRWTHEALRQSADEFHDLYEKAPCGYFSLASHGAFLQINATLLAWLGYRREEVVQITEFRHLLTPESAEMFESAFAGLKEHGRIDELGLDMVRKGSSVMPILLTAEAIRDSSDRYAACRGTVFDITERKKSEEHVLSTVKELKRSNDELQQFAYVASHDLQEPLRMVASYTQLLSKRYKGRLDSDADEFIAYAVDGSNRMQGLIQDLLAYSRAGTKGKVLHEISSENALKEALGNLRATIEESGAVVTQDSLPVITTDDMQLAQVFQNLVANAIKYHGAELPHVHVSARKNGGNEWIFSVRDNGMGISPQYFERIFVLFQRLHGREQFAGTGIGLAVCKKILERLGGRIWVESQPEQGSTFYFALPGRNGK